MQNASSEETIFENVAETRQAKPPGEPTNPTYSPDTKVSQLNLADGKRIGISKTLKVEQGDKLDFDIKYFFDNTQLSNDTITINDLLNSLANTFIYSLNSPSGTTAEAQQNWAASTFTGNQGLNNFLVNAFGTATINDPNKPQAFLVYLYFDDKFNFHPSESGLLQAANPNSLSDLAVLNLKIPESGYLYIYTNNESSHDVNFNNMRIHHWSGRVLEINEYYPYGYLNYELSSGKSKPLNKYKYNGKELQTDLTWNVEDYGARMYDPVIARWNSIDLLAEKIYNGTPYSYVENNPVVFLDPDGKIKHDSKGNVIFSAVGDPVDVSHPSGSTARVQMGYVYADDGTEIEAFRNISGDKGWDTDCHGVTFADGQVWINNDQVDKILKGDDYKKVDKSETQAGDKVVYRNESGDAEHSVTVVETKDGQVVVEGQGGLEKENHKDNVDKAWDKSSKQGYYRKDTKEQRPDLKPSPERRDNTNVGSGGDAANGLF